MRLLFAVPHYCHPDSRKGADHGSLRGDVAVRLASLTACLTALQQTFGRPQCVIDIDRRTTAPANHQTAVRADTVVCTTGAAHLLPRLSLNGNYLTHRPTDAEPLLLGFECHAALRERLGDYDYYCYLEDDLIVRDPWFFQKLHWFSRQFGDEAVLMPNRYEVAQGQIVHKAYIDGPLKRRATARFQNLDEMPELRGEVLGTEVVFRRPLNPHGGGFFLNARQMTHWAAQSHFLDRDTSFVGPLESAATLGVMKTFRIYKTSAEAANFLEVEHAGAAFLERIKRPADFPPGGAEAAATATAL